jgi:hypothetical protein
MIRLGDRVYLPGARFGEAGTVIRLEGGKLTVYWGDLDHWSQHVAQALEPAEVNGFSSPCTDWKWRHGHDDG